MKKMLLRTFTAALALVAASAFAQDAATYPNKPIRIIVPFTAGSATDILARTFGERLSSAWGQPVVVENRPGAGGSIGAGVVAKSAPDGYTLVVVSTGHVVNDVLYDNLGFDVVADFAGVAPLANLPSVLIVPPTLGVKTVKELVALAKDKPGELNFTSAGIGSASHINQEKFLHTTGIKSVHIPMKGTPDMLNEMMGGRVQMGWMPLISSVGPLKDGKLMALAVSTHERSSVLPNVPTIAEAGYPEAEFNFWVAMLAPKATPRDIVNKLNAEIQRQAQSPDVKKRLESLGAEPMPMDPEQFDAFLKSEHDTLGQVMKAAKK
jgi:tripartite-type tricarboxylate transporter receptor subunit TctC